MRTKLSVNINKVALIRNSRGSNLPNLMQFTKDCEAMGADGITVHPRPDQRHIRYDDIPLLKEIVTTELNIEGYPSPEFMKLVLENMPHQCTLVPDPPGVLTSSEGWKIDKNESFVRETIQELQSKQIRVSLFVDPIVSQIDMARKVGADRVELYTGDFAHQYNLDRKKAVQPHIDCSQRAAELGIGLNAGHDLDLSNLKFYSEQLVGLKEVSIGHALISDALYYGISNVIGMYKALLG
ncbi:MAG: pyridoxine 5-phosphate synthase [Saprospiraceae bacterium]|jgi:pyridoxine 5-phosphate synthase